MAEEREAMLKCGFVRFNHCCMNDFCVHCQYNPLGFARHPNLCGMAEEREAMLKCGFVRFNHCCMNDFCVHCQYNPLGFYLGGGKRERGRDSRAIWISVKFHP